MSARLHTLRDFLNAWPAALVEVVSAKGSTPREEGAWMLVSAAGILGTIGGGQLEFMAIDRARRMLGGGADAPIDDPGAHPDASPLLSPGEGRQAGAVPGSACQGTVQLSIPLGPEIGQCCGGRVELSIRIVDESARSALIGTIEAEEARLPHVLIFGGGHVGHALAAALAPLPVRATVVETRTDALEGVSAGVGTCLTPVPEEAVRAAPAGTAFVVLTHDHALDFLIVAEALKREDAAYVGMIGSATKKATFRSWYLKTAGGTPAAFDRLISPIGGDAVRDKRPAVIAALAAAEILTALAPPPDRSEP